MSTTDSFTAAEILRLAISQGENLPEFTNALNEEGRDGDDVWRRVHRAEQLGYLIPSEFAGSWSLSAKGESLLAAAG